MRKSGIPREHKGRDWSDLSTHNEYPRCQQTSRSQKGSIKGVLSSSQPKKATFLTLSPQASSLQSSQKKQCLSHGVCDSTGSGKCLYGISRPLTWLFSSLKRASRLEDCFQSFLWAAGATNGIGTCKHLWAPNLLTSQRFQLLLSLHFKVYKIQNTIFSSIFLLSHNLFPDSMAFVCFATVCTP